MASKKSFFYLFLCVICGLIASCTIRNKEIVGEQATIKDTDWVLLSFGNEEVPALQATRTSFIHFSEGNNKLKGFAGCNNFFGRFELNGEQLKITQLASTRASCPDMEAERYLLGVLENVSTYRISGNILTLYSRENPVATFQMNMGPTLEQEQMREGQ